MNQKKLSSYKVVLLTMLLFVSSAFSLYSQTALGVVKESPGEILSFEKKADIDKIESSKSSFKQTNAISLLSPNSLQWDWEKGATIKLPLYNFYSEVVRLSPFNKDQCLVLWIYNDAPSEGFVNLTVSGSDLGAISSKFYLNYTGWRTAHIPLSQMDGKAPQKGEFNPYEWLEIKIPENHPEAKGRYFIDDVYTTMLEERRPSADFQAPYIKAYFNGGEYATQWLDQEEVPTREEIAIKQIPISKGEVESFEKLYQTEFEEMTQKIKGKGLNDKKFLAIQEQFNELGIKQNTHDGKTYLHGPYVALAGEGLPKNIIEENTQLKKFIRLGSFQNILHSIAEGYHRSTDQEQKKALKEYFMLATRIYLQSGWAEGSNMGTLHHLGYSTRKLTPAFFMMKDELQAEGLLDEVERGLNWYNVSSVVNSDTHTKPDLDLFNTVLPHHYLSAMMHSKKEDAARHLKLLSRWLSNTFADDAGHGGFKHDGTAWHHWGHYPAYTNTAIDNAVIAANNLTAAGFPLTKEGHQALQNAVKTVMIYSQGNAIPTSLSGRHPLTGTHKKFINSDYLATFVNIAPTDNELKELHKYHTTNIDHAGHWTLPYTAMNLHRRDNYLVSVRGFGIYAWGSEVYNFNRFGRYQSYGTIDILYKDDEQIAYEGYDWNLYPGTTITYLPLEELEAPLPVFMVKSLSRFANGVQDKEGMNGAHGFILDESILVNIDPAYQEVPTKEKLQARKSTFFLDDIVLNIGTNITGQNSEHPVYTVVAQEGIAANEREATIGGEKIGKFPFDGKLTGKQMLYDGKRNGYLVIDENSALNVSMKQQVSRGDEATFNELRKPPRGKKNGKVNMRREPETKGDFFTVTLNHGIQPTDAEYMYAILPGVNKDEFNRKATQIMENPELYYHVISRKSNLHAVRDIRNNAETYICYEAQQLIPHSSLHEVSEPCLVMFKYDNTNSQSVSVALPDLHQSAYSREQKDKQWTSAPHNLTLTFDGVWSVEIDNPSLLNIEHTNGKTVVTIKAQHGVSNHFKMIKQ